MAKKMTVDRTDDRIERAIRDPKGYFTAARERARREVREEMDRDRGRAPRSRPAT